MSEDLHEITQRIQELMAHYSPRSDDRIVVADFAKIIGISHQVLNRCFNIDKRSGKYPRPSQGILSAIKKSLTDVNADWLLTGEGPMLKSDAQKKSMICEESAMQYGVPPQFVQSLFKERERADEIHRINAETMARLSQAIESKLDECLQNEGRSKRSSG